MVSKSQIKRRAELEEEGWTRQFTADEPRLSEAVEMYKLLGVLGCTLSPWSPTGTRRNVLPA
jgi:hypothetical protein